MGPTGAMLDRGRPSRYHLDPGELRAWIAFLRAHAAVTRSLESDLVAHASMSLADYEVLAFLSAEPGWRLRMSDLADRALLTRSRLTHTVDRLERFGFVERVACETDRRGSYASLTDAGMESLRRAAPGHVAAVRRILIDVLTHDEIVALAAGLGRVVGERGAGTNAEVGRAAPK